MDTLVIMVAIRLITGSEIDDWLRPLFVAVFSSVASSAITWAAGANPDYQIVILLVALAAIPLCVMIGCWLALDLPVKQAALVGAIFFAYKILFVGILIVIALVTTSAMA